MAGDRLQALQGKKKRRICKCCVCMMAEDHIWPNTVTDFPTHQLQKSLIAKEHSSGWKISIPGAILGHFSRELANILKEH